MNYTAEYPLKHDGVSKSLLFIEETLKELRLKKRDLMEALLISEETMLLLVLILSLGAPIAPGTLILCLVTLLTQMGIDISVISLVIGINFILEMLLGMVNSVGDVVVALLVARKEGTLDLDTYRKK